MVKKCYLNNGKYGHYLNHDGAIKKFINLLHRLRRHQPHCMGDKISINCGYLGVFFGFFRIILNPYQYTVVFNHVLLGSDVL